MNISQGEVWEIEFCPNVGSEIGKKRPGIVVSCNDIGKLPLRTVVPITGWASSFAAYPWMVHLAPDAMNGLTKESAIDCFQIRNFSVQRFVRKLGKIDDDLLAKIQQTIIKTISLS